MGVTRAVKKKIFASLSILVVERGFAVTAALAKFSGDTSADPSHLHEVHFSAARAEALHFRFSETFDFGQFIKFQVGVL